MQQDTARSAGELALFSDLDLARRLERAEAISSARFVEARQQVSPGCGAEWRDFGGAYAMFDGPDSPITQTFGLGLFSAVNEAALDEIEEFFRARGAAANHEVSPLAGVEVFAALAARGYRPVEFTSVLYRSTRGGFAAREQGAGITVRAIQEEEATLWARVSAEGWSDAAPELFDFILDIGSVVARKQDSQSWLAYLDGNPVAAAALSLCGSVAHLAGAATLPSARGNGAQFALLQARLEAAAAAGCEIALMGAAPGSASQRNAERHGFRIAYTRQKWQRGFD
ncbi:MAG: GNAT family N-acetyltransferase [Bryobacter sp.]|nr:GNAT family N-acetyltransferase [Bryobacter sp.]